MTSIIYLSIGFTMPILILFVMYYVNYRYRKYQAYTPLREYEKTCGKYVDVNQTQYLVYQIGFPTLKHDFVKHIKLICRIFTYKNPRLIEFPPKQEHASAKKEEKSLPVWLHELYTRSQLHRELLYHPIKNSSEHDKKNETIILDL